MNRNLKLKIVEKFGTSQAFSEACGIDSSTISKILRGIKEPTEDQKVIIAKTLRIRKDILFPPKGVHVDLKLVENVRGKARDSRVNEK